MAAGTETGHLTRDQTGEREDDITRFFAYTLQGTLNLKESFDDECELTSPTYRSALVRLYCCWRPVDYRVVAAVPPPRESARS